MIALMFALPAAKIFHGHVRQTRPIEALEFVTGVRPEHALTHEDIPTSLDWRNVDGISYVTADVNQHIPQYCGGCWIHGTLAALNDRIKMARKAAFPDVMLARQVVVNCVPPHNKSDAPPGCNGGDPFLIHHYMKHKSIPDETCQPYEAKNGVCDDMGTCRNCLPSPNIVGKDCWAMPSYVRYGVSEYGSVSGEKAMQKEILARGPIVCSLAADEQFMFEFGKVIAEHDGVYIDRRPKTKDEVDHDVEIAGWGVTDSGIKFWVVRNSWGSYWGQHGWFKILRGENMMFIESECDWAVPTSDNLNEVLSGAAVGDYVQGLIPTSDLMSETGAAMPSLLGALSGVLATVQQTHPLGPHASPPPPPPPFFFATPPSPSPSPGVFGVFASHPVSQSWAGLAILASRRSSQGASPASQPGATRLQQVDHPSEEPPPQLLTSNADQTPLAHWLMIATAVGFGLLAGFSLAAWRARRGAEPHDGHVSTMETVFKSEAGVGAALASGKASLSAAFKGGYSSAPVDIQDSLAGLGSPTPYLAYSDVTSHPSPVSEYTSPEPPGMRLG